MKRTILILFCLLSSGCEGCMRRPPAESVDLGEWPACASAPREELLVARELVSGPSALEKGVRERYSIAKHGECYVGRMHLSWRLGETALEIVWDEDFVPLAAYKRMGYPGQPDQFDERAYRMDARSAMVRRAPGELERFTFRGETRPLMVLPTGRGLFSAAFLRAKEHDLEVGESVRETTIDLRRLVERVELGSVRRDPTRKHEFTEQPTETYTYMGRDTMFTDERGFVIADLAGLVPGDAEFVDPFEGVEPPVDAAKAFGELSALGRGEP